MQNKSGINDNDAAKTDKLYKVVSKIRIEIALISYYADCV